MKKLMKISAFLLALVMCVTSVIPAYAAEKTENGVTLTMTMDKANYSEEETVTATITLKNDNQYAVSNVSLEGIVPDGYTLQMGENESTTIGTIDAGAEKNITVNFVPVQEGVKIFATDFEDKNPFTISNRDVHTVALTECADDTEHGKVVEFKRNESNNQSFFMDYSGLGSSATSVVYEFDVKLLDGANTYLRMMLKDGSVWDTPIRILGGKILSTNEGGDEKELASLDNAWHTIAVVCNYQERTFDVYVDGTQVGTTDKLVMKDTFNAGQNTAAKVQQLRFFVDAGENIDHFMLDNVRVYEGTKPYEGELIVPEIVIDPSESIFDIEKLDTSKFPGMLEGYISLHTRNGMVYQGSKAGQDGTKTKLATQPVETADGFLVVAEEICEAFNITYNVNGDSVTIDGKQATVVKKDGKLWINAEYFFETILGKQVAIDTEAKSDGMMIAGDTKFEFPSAEKFETGIVSNLRSELQNLNDYLFFERPTDTQILEAYNASELKGQHPRIMATSDDFTRLREEVKTDPYKKAWYNQLLVTADKLVEENTTPLKFELRDGLRLCYVAFDLIDNIYTLAMAYQLTGDMEYVERAWVDLQAVSEFATWYAIPLDPGAFATGVAIGYDWMYDALTQEQKQVLEKAMYENAYRIACDEYMGKNALLDRTVVSYNQCIIINSELALGALAFMDVYPELSAYIVSNAVRAADVSMTEYGPDGAWIEGPHYWDYTTQFTTKLLSCLDIIFGTCFSLDACEGLDNSAFYMLNVQSDVSVFNYNDGSEYTIYPPEMLYLSNKYNKPEITSAVLEVSNGRLFGDRMFDEDIALSLLWYDTSIKASDDEMPPLDSAYKEEGVVTFRDQWSSEPTTFVGMHGGENLIVHGQLDAGSFIYDYAGIRWITELGDTPYDTSVTGQYYIEGGRWRLYRTKAEAHNTIVIVNEDTLPTNTDQVVDAEAIFTKLESDAKGSIAVLDMTEIYGQGAEEEAYAQGATKATRGFFFTDDRTSLVVRDEISLFKDNSTVYSFMHTDAEVELAADGKSAILTQGGKKIKLEFATTGNGTATLGYGPSTRNMLGTISPINAPVSTDYNKYDVEDADVNRIYVKLENASGDVGITMKLTPVGVKGTPVSDYNVSLDTWTIPEGNIAARPEAQSVTIDGCEVNFDFSKQATFLCVADKYETVPEAVVKVDETKFTYQVTNAGSTDGGNTTIVVSDKTDSSVFTTYTVKFVEIPEPKEFEGETSLQVVNVEVNAEPQADRGNYKWRVLDNDVNTLWTAVDGQNWILLELEEETTIDKLRMVFYQCHKRLAYFSIHVSKDGKEWETVLNEESALNKPEIAKSAVIDAGTYQEFDVGGKNAKYVRIDCYGNSAQEIINGWDSICEIVLSQKTTSTAEPTPTPDVEPTPAPSTEPTATPNTGAGTDADADEGAGSNDSDDNDDNTTDVVADAAPTGDSGNVHSWSFLATIALAGAVIVAVRYRKKIKNIVSVLLVCALMSGMFGNVLQAEANEIESLYKTLSVTETVTVGEKQIAFAVSAKYMLLDENTEINGYIKVTEGSSGGYYGTMLTDVSAGDTLVMDAALRVEDGLSNVAFYSKPTGSTAKLFNVNGGWIKDGTNQTKIVKLSTDEWTEIRMVWKISSDTNNFILYKYTDGAYVEVYKATVATTASSTALDSIRFQTENKDTGRSLHLDDFSVYTTSATEYTCDTLTAVKTLYEQNYDASCSHEATVCPANGASNATLKYRATVTHETEVVIKDSGEGEGGETPTPTPTVAPTPTPTPDEPGTGGEGSETTKSNGYITITEHDGSSSSVSGMYGVYLEKYGVTTSDKVVMDVALRVENGLGKVNFYSQLNGGSATALFTIENSAIVLGEQNIPLSTDAWTEIRIVWNLASTQDNFILYEYDGEKYVQKCVANKVTTSNVPDDIRFQTDKKTGKTLHIDNFAVYTTAVTDYTGETLTPVTELYKQNYDAVCSEHGAATCPAYLVNDANQAIQRCRNTAHATETVAENPGEGSEPTPTPTSIPTATPTPTPTPTPTAAPTGQTNGYITITEHDGSSSSVSGIYGVYLEKYGVTTNDTVVMDVALRVEAGLGKVNFSSQVNGGGTSALFKIENGAIVLGEQNIPLSTDTWTNIRLVWNLASTENNFVLYEYDGEKYVQKYVTSKNTTSNVPDDIRFQTDAKTAKALHLDNFAVYTAVVNDYTSETLVPVTELYKQNYDVICIEHGTATCPAYLVNDANQAIQRCRNTAHASETVTEADN